MLLIFLADKPKVEEDTSFLSAGFVGPCMQFVEKVD